MRLSAALAEQGKKVYVLSPTDTPDKGPNKVKIIAAEAV